MNVINIITPDDLIISTSPPIPTALFPTYLTDDDKKESTIDKANKEKKKSNAVLSYKDYSSNPDILKTYKIPDLKSIAKNLRIHFTCTKPVLIERIKNHFNRVSNIIVIQRVIRGHMVRKCFQLRGDGFYDRSICINDSDPCTLEPLSELDHELFFSYRDNKGHIYGFNIISLITFLKTTKKIENPYTREVLDKDTVDRVIHLYKIICIIFSDIIKENDAPIITNQHINSINVTQRYSQVNTNNTRTQYVMNQINTPVYQDLVAKLERVRARTIQERINELFIEIDQLGNYTHSSWFSELTRGEYFRLYRCLYDIWNYRAHIPYSIKRGICIICDPFYNIIPYTTNNYLYSLSYHDIQRACLAVFENMIYCGLDIEYRRIGTFHALSALTLVSPTARLAMPWLYESVAF